MAKILAIDDKQDNLMLVSALLKNLIPDCLVLTSQSGKSGIVTTKKERPDVVLLDIRMPEMDGFEVCRRLKSDESTKHIPVIMITAVAKDSTSRVEGLDSGADAFLTKPIDPSELAAQVKVALRIKYAEDRLRNEKDFLEEMVNKRTKALRESENRFQNLVENLLVGIAIIKNNMIIYQNPEQDRIFGNIYQNTDIRSIRFIHPDDRDQICDFYRKALAGKTDNKPITFRFFPEMSKNAEIDMKWVQFRASRVSFENEKALLFCMIDITRTKELERLVNIEDKMSSLGRIAAGIAHEIRNPLSTINIYLSLLQRYYTNPDHLDCESLDTINESIEKMETASRKIETVIKRVLDFSRPNTPKMGIVDINDCIRGTLEFTEVMLLKNSVGIKTLFQDDLPQCYIESQAISQVILNLISNAVQAMKEMSGNKQITIKTVTENNYICIKISDTGPGIPQGIRDRIFDPFYTTRSSGSGIGLSISHRIVTDHGGFLNVSNIKSGGAQFVIKLPVKSG